MHHPRSLPTRDAAVASPRAVDADASRFQAVARAAADLCGTSAFVTLIDGDRERVDCVVAVDGARDVVDALASLSPGSADLDAAAARAFPFVVTVPFAASTAHATGRLFVVGPVRRVLGDAALRMLDQLATIAGQLLDADVATTRANDARARTAWLQEATPAMLHSIDARGVLLGVSDAWLREMGYTRDEVVGRPIGDFLTPASYARARDEVIPRLFETGSCEGIEYDMLRKDGSLIVALVSAVVEYDAAGTPLRTLTVSSNITGQRAAERALREEQERLARILEGTGAGTWELNIQTGETRHNARWAEIAGYTLAELGKTSGATWRELMHKDDLQPAVDLCVAHYEGKVDYYEKECRIRHKSGAWLWIVDRGRVSARDATGAPLWMHGTRTDITSRKRAEEALRASQNFLERVGEVAGVGGWELDCRTARMSWSAEMRRLYAVDDAFVPTIETALSYFAPDVQALLEGTVRDCMVVGTPFDLELPFVSATGRALWTRATGSAEFVGGKAVRLVGSLQDVTRRKQMERELAESRELLEVTLESIADAVITADNDGIVQWLNPVAERMTGWPRRDAVGRPIGDVFVIVDEATRQPATDPITTCLRKAAAVDATGHVTLVARDGTTYGIEHSSSPILRADGTAHGAVLVFRDVSEQRRLHHEMRHRASHDVLTGLLNRGEFENRLGRLLAGVDDDCTSSVLYVDLDQFKVVNDACGHAAGDQLLRQVSAILARCVRASDSVARLGGDEFGIILANCNALCAQSVAQHICDEMDTFRFVHDGRRFRVGTSIGLVPVDQRWTTMKALLQAADAACYAAKDGGRNRVHVWRDSDQMLEARQGDMRWVSRLESALDEDRFELHGQRIEPVDGSVSGLHVEVLLRLREPDGTLVLPGAFLPAAERFHLATRIDRWVVRHAFARLAGPRARDVDIALLSINLSGQSLVDREFHRDVLAQVRDAAFDVRCLCFEITETVAITHLCDARGFIEALRALGVKVALDDFGAGASSFGYLKQLPVDFLKVDGHFIRHLLDDPLNDAAVRCFADVARIVGVKTIAEFVEDEQTRSALHAIGVDLAQGYLLHRPEALDALLTGDVTRPALAA